MRESTMEATQSAFGPGMGGLSLAKVESVEGASVRVRGASFGCATARLAVPTETYSPQRGDAVLVGRADDGGCYVVGVVRALRRVDEPDKGEGVASERPAIVAADGTRAQLEADGGEDVLRVRGADGSLILEHRPSEGCSVIHAAGDLALSTAGDLDLSADGAVRVRAGADLHLEGAQDVRIGARDLDGALGSSFKMRGGVTELLTRRLGARVERADVKLDEANLVVGTLRSVADRVKHDVSVLETRAGRLVEHAQEAWRETEGLAQTRAGRLSLIAAGALMAVGEQTLLKAREDVKIKGDKIYLA